MRTPMPLLTGFLAVGLLTAAPASFAAPEAPAPTTGTAEGTAPKTENAGTAIPSPLTLDAAIRLALANHPQVAAANSQHEAARARVTEARSAYFPQISPAYQYSRQYTAFNTGDGTRTGTITQNTTSIGLDQTLFDMGKRELNMARSRDSEHGAEYDVRNVRQGVIENVSTSWYELLRSKELVRVAESGVERAKTTLDATQAFVEAGSSARKDVLQAQADYDNAQVQAIQSRNNVRLAETSLKNAIGIRTAQPIVTPEAPVEAPPTAPDTRGAPEYIDAALSNRPDLKASEAGISASRRSVKIARIEAGPQVNSTYSAGYRVNPDPGRQTSLNLGVSYPLFDAGAVRARVREAKASLQASEQQLELSRQDIAASVESAYLVREEAKLRITAAETARKAAQENYAAATESRKEGVGTILDVITAQNQLITAETNAVQAVYDYYTADARLKRAIGDNDPYLSEGKPS